MKQLVSKTDKMDPIKAKIAEFRVVDLKEALSKLGLEKSGVKSALVERLATALIERGVQYESITKEYLLSSPKKGKEGAKSNEALTPEAKFKMESSNTEEFEDTLNITVEDEDASFITGQESIDEPSKKGLGKMIQDNQSEDDLVKNEDLASMQKKPATNNVENETVAKAETVDNKSTEDTSFQIGIPPLDVKQEVLSEDENETTLETSTNASVEELGAIDNHSQMEDQSSATSDSCSSISGNQTAEKGDASKDKRHVLVVTGLPRHVNAKHVKLAFKKHAKIASVRIITSAKSLGFRLAHVAALTEDGAQKCIEKMDSTTFEGCLIRVEKAPEHHLHLTPRRVENLATFIRQEKAEKDPSTESNHKEYEEVQSDAKSVNKDEKNECSSTNVSVCEEEGWETEDNENNFSGCLKGLMEENMCGLKMDALDYTEEEHIDRSALERESGCKAASSDISASAVDMVSNQNVTKPEENNENACTTSSETLEGTKLSKRRLSSNSGSNGKGTRSMASQEKASPSKEKSKDEKKKKGSNRRERRHRLPREVSRRRNRRYSPIVKISRTWGERIRSSRSPPYPHRSHRYHRSSSPIRSHLTFEQIREHRERERVREEERKLRERDRREREELERQRALERRNMLEFEMLQRERERLRKEREKVERDKLELIRLEKERQRAERNKIDKDKQNLRRAQLKIEESRRGKRGYKEMMEHDNMSTRRSRIPESISKRDSRKEALNYIGSSSDERRYSSRRNKQRSSSPSREAPARTTSSWKKEKTRNSDEVRLGYKEKESTSRPRMDMRRDAGPLITRDMAPSDPGSDRYSRSSRTAAFAIGSEASYGTREAEWGRRVFNSNVEMANVSVSPAFGRESWVAEKRLDTWQMTASDTNARWVTATGSLGSRNHLGPEPIMPPNVYATTAEVMPTPSATIQPYHMDRYTGGRRY